jgi:hypothetical protein
MSANLVQYNLQKKELILFFVKSTTMENFGHLINCDLFDETFCVFNSQSLILDFKTWCEHLASLYILQEHAHSKRGEIYDGFNSKKRILVA